MSRQSTRYEVAEPLEREITMPGGTPPPLKYLRSDPGQPARRVAEPETTTERPPRVAVLIAHGMGQQVKFQTIDQVEQGLRRAEEAATTDPAGQSPSRVRTVKYGSEILERLELTLTSPSDPKIRTEVHLFEGYWAPLTEGRVGLRDVFSFLLGGGWNGLRLSRGEFKRWVFGERRTFDHNARTGWQLLLALAVGVSLIFLNAVVTLAWAALLAPGGNGGRVTPALLRDLTLTVAALLLIALGAGLLMLKLTRMGLFYLVLIAIVAAAIIIGAIILPRHWLGYGSLWPEGILAGLGVDPQWVGRIATSLQVLTWALLVAASWKARGVLVQYVGDVAAYVSPHRLDRFDEIRTEIKNCVGRVAEAIYAAREGSNFEYDHVAVVGHSLGSVVAYDIVNGLINLDRLLGEPFKAVNRTCLLLTFGSPLDKTAYVFATQSSKTTDSREALAAARQPMIEHYKFRPFPWINVYSPKDIISGPLDFYDRPKPPPRPPEELRVDNVEDLEADRPIYAHVQYWANSAVFQRLHAVVTSCGRPPRAVAVQQKSARSTFD